MSVSLEVAATMTSMQGFGKDCLAAWTAGALMGGAQVAIKAGAARCAVGLGASNASLFRFGRQHVYQIALPVVVVYER